MFNNHVYTAHDTKLFKDLSLKARWKMYQKLIQKLPLSSLRSILDVGVTADKTRDDSNFFEKMFPEKDKITALSNQQAHWLESEYPGLKFVQGDARKMPFPDNAFDFVFSSAVIEHVGSFEWQKQMISECVRVSKRYVCILTPYRFYPVELHTILPLIHWLPRKAHRWILKKIGFAEMARESNLHLLSRSDVYRMCRELRLSKPTIVFNYFFGFPSNLMIFFEKKPPLLPTGEN